MYGIYEQVHKFLRSAIFTKGILYYFTKGAYVPEFIYLHGCNKTIHSFATPNETK